MDDKNGFNLDKNTTYIIGKSMNINTISILKGMVTCIPGIYRLTSKYTGGTNSARY
jgi:hypothetical protein